MKIMKRIVYSVTLISFVIACSPEEDTLSVSWAVISGNWEKRSTVHSECISHEGQLEVVTFTSIRSYYITRDTVTMCVGYTDTICKHQRGTICRFTTRNDSVLIELSNNILQAYNRKQMSTEFLCAIEVIDENTLVMYRTEYVDTVYRRDR